MRPRKKHLDAIRLLNSGGPWWKIPPGVRRTLRRRGFARFAPRAKSGAIFPVLSTKAKIGWLSKV